MFLFLFRIVFVIFVIVVVVGGVVVVVVVVVVVFIPLTSEGDGRRAVPSHRLARVRPLHGEGGKGLLQANTGGSEV
jgi:hypothetical protein